MAFADKHIRIYRNTEQISHCYNKQKQFQNGEIEKKCLISVFVCKWTKRKIAKDVC